jgi:uncharacterized cupin superfamily protein
VLAHWDEAESSRRDRGHISGLWTDLGRAAGSVAVGLRRIRVDPGAWSTPAHVHGREEELYYVLGGSGLLWENGETYEVGPGDCVVEPPDARAHTFHGGPDGLDVLAFGERLGDEAAYLPRAGVLWLGNHYVDAGRSDRGPWDLEVAAGPPPLPAAPSPRPETIVHVPSLDPRPDPPREGYRGEHRFPTRGRGVRRTGIRHVVLDPGQLSAPHHCHGAEEELFVVLAGEATLELVPAPRAPEPEQRELPLRAGHVVARPAGTGVAHGFRAGPGGATILMYGQNDPNEIAYYPRSNKLLFAGVGLVARVEPLDYWDGEEDARRTPLP